MKKIAGCLLVVALLFALTRCAAPTPTVSEPPRPPQWSYEPNAIHLHLRADPRLNLYQNSPHTLMVCVYQMTDPNTFNQLADEKNGLYKLLECQRFDATITNAKRLVIQPGQDETFHLDRAEGSKYVGLAVGYYNLEKRTAVRMFPIPVAEDAKTRVSRPAHLNLDVFLAPQTLQVSGEKP